MDPSFGPVELVALAFDTPLIPPPVTRAVRDVTGSGAVTLLDLAVVRRGDDGELVVLEAEDVGDEAEVVGVELAAPGLTGEEDLQEIAAAVDPGTSVLVLAIEHTWSRQLVSAAVTADADVILHERVPAVIVNEIVAQADETSAGTQG
ncbi:DUF6325 family protein [Myceligenerans pegani]|uniref:Uncharacterized protein n=1 Tax=Myceligenerans pegani TaxID=2776917 RepID=A0ABR9MXR7_9MICO|nr:DUF6325 family protein [Myceligenerans sp. TRM 65318]MBE1875846.1 hypothetical protein [Myceligenerans sp. TRM 65318]MBE3018117.1 hypothetical protein [Myceligenerans sp. TRM 65318]